MTFEERLDRMEEEIRDPSLRQNQGRANEVNYWIFDYAPSQELAVRARIEAIKANNERGNDDFSLAVYDIYDLIMNRLEQRKFLEKTYRLEEKGGMDQITQAIGNMLRIDDEDNLLVQYIQEHTPENAVVFLTGIGKCYPLLHPKKILSMLLQTFRRAPVVLFFPGTYDERSLMLFDEIKDDNHYRAFRLGK